MVSVQKVEIRTARDGKEGMLTSSSESEKAASSSLSSDSTFFLLFLAAAFLGAFVTPTFLTATFAYESGMITESERDGD